MRQVTILAIMIVISCGCLNLDPDELDRDGYELGEQFQLGMNESTWVLTDGLEDLEVEFINISEDSRCPPDVACVWAGQVTAVVEVVAGNSIEELNMTLGDNATRALALFQAWIFELLVVDPEPRSNGTIEASEYVITLVVT